MSQAVVLAIVLAPCWLYLVASAALARRFARRRLAAAAARPAVSLLKPLYGAEPGLYENLRSFAEQDYPQVQIVLGVHREDDGAVPVARALIGDLPGRDIVLAVEERVTGSNAKVSNLQNMLRRAGHEVLVIADSDMRVEPHYLAAVTAPLEDPAVGLVTCLYSGAGSGGLWSALGALYINFGFLPSALVGAALGWGGGCFGATIALRREVLERIGGLGRLRDELADDHAIGKAVRELGLEVRLSRYLVEDRVCEPSLADLWRHELRWARTNRSIAPAGFAGSVITYPAPIAALAAAATGFSLTAGLFLVMSLLLRWLSARLIARALGLAPASAFLLVARDILSFAVFIASFFGNTVFWRDQVVRLAPNGRMTVVGE
ncbi:MAG TPA: bacteriohopanetetrol glucosamine biosynthesis glycosyltransferase HpnI [Stellaceae bacterium]|nr:bacteriohopanetetrol glucosamine biosynthesis glycosyltransferase HpnI [Stellaceae bacterium]